jgi:uncharacterized membrane-anchored protein YhcB (DUF1043 family)
MTWLIGLISFAVGLLVGALLYKQLKSDEAKVLMLEEQLENVERDLKSYKDNVHSHFNNTAALLNNLTDSYHEVYRHMAAGAQTLCPEYISEQLSHSAQAQESLTRDTFTQKSGDAVLPPRDYADKSSHNLKGNLAEDYVLEKIGD